ncbi:MAG: radical SAM protein [Candidatus Electrothrix sp. MAN1_4]|nr:radical SAM protein [Candidatus Electrothrix sp. MAN1_4]
MRIVLINSNRYRRQPIIPFGLCAVAATLEQAGHEVHGLDLCFSENCVLDITDKVESVNPDVIGISVRNIDSCTGHNLHFFLQEIKNDVIDPCKQAFSGPIVIGGPSVGINGPEMLTFFDLHYAIQGDGEAAMLEFIRRVERHLPFSNIEGLVIREHDHIIENNSPWRVADLDALPFINPSRYFDLQPYLDKKAKLQIQTKRGCALKCSYCTYNDIEGRSYRYRSPQRVADEIEYLVKETGIKTIEFTDSTFNVPLDHAKAVLRAIAAKNIALKLYTLGMHPKSIDQELIALMKAVNFEWVALGIEAGNNAMLKSLGKNFTTKDIHNAGKLLHDANIRLCWSLLIGAPGETEDTIRETFETMDRIVVPQDEVMISIGIRVYKGTPIAKMLLSEKEVCSTDNFFQPYLFLPDTLSLEKMYTLTEQITRGKDNYVILGEPSCTKK